MRGTLLALGLCVAGLAAVARGDDWPQFRGPDGAAVGTASQLPAAWGADKNVAWKAKLPGYGWSSPIVWGDKVFVTTAASDKQKKPVGGGFGGGNAPQDVGAWLHIGEDGRVSVYTGKAEVGQNIRTSLTQAVAEGVSIGAHPGFNDLWGFGRRRIDMNPR